MYDGFDCSYNDYGISSISSLTSRHPRPSANRGRARRSVTSATRPSFNSLPRTNLHSSHMSTSLSRVFTGRTRPRNKQTPEITRVTHNKVMKINIFCQSTSVKADKPSLNDVYKEPIVILNGIYYFDTEKFELSYRRDVWNGQFEILTYDVTSGKSKFLVDLKGTMMTMDLSKRHVFDKNFYMHLKYSLMDQRGAFYFDSKYHFKIPYFLTESEVKFTQLDQFYPDREITNVFYKEAKTQSLESYLGLGLFERLEKGVNFEDLAARDALKHLSLHDVTVEGSQKNYFLRVDSKIIRKIKNERWREMSLCFIPMELYRETYNHPENCYYVQIGEIGKDLINIDSMKYLDQSFEYHVDFIPNRIGARACLNALQSLEESGLSSHFLKFEKTPVTAESIMMGYRSRALPDVTSRKMNALKQSVFNIFHFAYFNKNIESNEEQKLAIQNILNCTAYPLPQVVFGPPGTGKTSTLVECVAQIVKLRPESRVLIATQSNSASDEIGVRLVEHVSKNKVYRFYSPSVLNPLNGGPNKILKACSNLRGKKVEWPTQEELKHFNVVISTLITSSRLAQSDISAEHFDYIFVDEISCATEPEALVPIIGCGTSGSEVTASIVLLGDHKQLGPVLTSEEFAGALGLGMSLMERMMACETYKKNPKFDERFVIQLLDNYRSHPAILKFSSDKFYDGTLRPKMSAHVQQMTETWNFLPNKKFPIIFHNCTTASQLDGTSSYNMGEIDAVRIYVTTLLATKFDGKYLVQSDIGIISPYLAQLKKLKEDIGGEWANIEMGTAEYFQGREKRVIIISTVKSQGGIGFLSNEKRCNVILTRAKSFEVLIGNHETLKKDQFWKAFIDYCIENRSAVAFNEMIVLTDQLNGLNFFK